MTKEFEKKGNTSFLEKLAFPLILSSFIAGYAITPKIYHLFSNVLQTPQTAEQIVGGCMSRTKNEIRSLYSTSSKFTHEEIEAKLRTCALGEFHNSPETVRVDIKTLLADKDLMKGMVEYVLQKNNEGPVIPKIE